MWIIITRTRIFRKKHQRLNRFVVNIAISFEMNFCFYFINGNLPKQKIIKKNSFEFNVFISHMYASYTLINETKNVKQLATVYRFRMNYILSGFIKMHASECQYDTPWDVTISVSSELHLTRTACVSMGSSHVLMTVCCLYYSFMTHDTW